MTDTITRATGLSSAEVKRLQQQYGKNELTPQKKESFLRKVLHIICEPMFLLLIVAAVIYFILGEPRDGAGTCRFRSILRHILHRACR